MNLKKKRINLIYISENIWREKIKYQHISMISSKMITISKSSTTFKTRILEKARSNNIDRGASIEILSKSLPKAEITW